MACKIDEELPEGWEKHISPGEAFVLYVNTQAKKGTVKIPNVPGGWTLVARNPIRHPPRSPEANYREAGPSHSANILPDSTSDIPHHRVSRHLMDAQPEEIRCSHILIKHFHSRRPMSWRCENIRRSKEEALNIVTDFRKQIMTNESRFEEIANIFSDCESAKRFGDLGCFKRGHMQYAFETVAFQLKVGQLSWPVETRSGIHLILRTL